MRPAGGHGRDRARHHNRSTFRSAFRRAPICREAFSASSLFFARFARWSGRSRRSGHAHERCGHSAACRGLRCGRASHTRSCSRSVPRRRYRARPPLKAKSSTSPPPMPLASRRPPGPEPGVPPSPYQMYALNTITVAAYSAPPSMMPHPPPSTLPSAASVAWRPRCTRQGGDLRLGWCKPSPGGVILPRVATIACEKTTKQPTIDDQPKERRNPPSAGRGRRAQALAAPERPSLHAEGCRVPCAWAVIEWHKLPKPFCGSVTACEKATARTSSPLPPTSPYLVRASPVLAVRLHSFRLSGALARSLRRAAHGPSWRRRS
jgi:hypothetical protein